MQELKTHCPRTSWRKSTTSEKTAQLLKEITTLRRELLLHLGRFQMLHIWFAFSASTMKEVACFCMSFSSLWEQMVKAYKYITGIFSVTHTSEQQASDRDKQPTKMDVSLLEEQYDHIKQKQKLQSHIIVFKTGMLRFIGNDVNVDVKTFTLNIE